MSHGGHRRVRGWRCQGRFSLDIFCAFKMLYYMHMLPNPNDTHSFKLFNDQSAKDQLERYSGRRGHSGHKSDSEGDIAEWLEELGGLDKCLFF